MLDGRYVLLLVPSIGAGYTASAKAAVSDFKRHSNPCVRSSTHPRQSNLCGCNAHQPKGDRAILAWIMQTSGTLPRKNSKPIFSETVHATSATRAGTLQLNTPLPTATSKQVRWPNFCPLACATRRRPVSRRTKCASSPCGGSALPHPWSE